MTLVCSFRCPWDHRSGKVQRVGGIGMIRGGTSYLIREVGVGQEALLSRPWAPDTPPPEEKGFWKHRPRGGVGRGLVVGAFYVSPPPSRSRGAFTPLHPRLPFHATPSVNLPPCPCGGQQCHLPADGLSLSSGGQLLSRGTSECRFFPSSPFKLEWKIGLPWPNT